MKLAVVVGRFQVDNLHDGHLKLLRQASEGATLMVFIGVADQKFTDCDPLPFTARKHLILDKFPAAIVMPILDHPDDKVWSEQLDIMIRPYEADQVTIFAGSEEFKRHYFGEYAVRLVSNVSVTCGTARRKEISRWQSPRSEEFRQGIIYATQNQFPRVIPCVDILPFALQDPSKPLKDDESRCEYLPEPYVIVGRKTHDGDRVRLIGGHVDPKETLEAAVTRELHEEVQGNLESLTLPMYVGSRVVDDWRHKKSRNNIISTVFIQEFTYTKKVEPAVINGKSELCWAGMIPLSEADAKIHDIHLGIFQQAYIKILEIYRERIKKYGK